MNQVQRVNTLAIIGGIFLTALLIGQHMLKGDSPKSVASNIEKLPVSLFATSTKEIWHGDTSKKQVIFTFDGGDAATSGNEILDTLKMHNVKSTFFLTGKFIEENPTLVLRMHTEGHEIYNHTYDHPHLTSVSDQQIISQLNITDGILIGLTGSTTRPYFRAPYGDRDERILDVAGKNGYRSIYWTIDARDWQESTGITADKVMQKILENIKPGNIFLMHIGDNITGMILDKVFSAIEDRGYKIVSLSQGL